MIAFSHKSHKFLRVSISSVCLLVIEFKSMNSTFSFGNLKMFPKSATCVSLMIDSDRYFPISFLMICWMTLTESLYSEMKNQVYPLICQTDSDSNRKIRHWKWIMERIEQIWLILPNVGIAALAGAHKASLETLRLVMCATKSAAM